MTLDEMRALSEFCDGYKKLCEETGVYLKATTEGALFPAFMNEGSELKLELQETTSYLIAEPVAR